MLGRGSSRKKFAVYLPRLPRRTGGASRRVDEPKKTVGSVAEDGEGIRNGSEDGGDADCEKGWLGIAQMSSNRAIEIEEGQGGEDEQHDTHDG